jgi:sugar lactone lactonase YvrE
MAKIEVLSDGMGLVESVRWHDGAVWFSDWMAGTIYRLDPKTRERESVAQVQSLPLCFDFLGDELVVLDGIRGLVLRGKPGEELSPWIDVHDQAAGAGNEVLVHGDNVYLNFGNFNPRDGFPTSPVGILSHAGADGRARIQADHLNFPNGMAITPDGTTLIVAESYSNQLSAWTVDADGSLADQRVWAKTPGLSPDGICLAPDDSCWISDVGSASVVRITQAGEVQQTIQLDRGAFSCALAPEIGTLFVAAAHWPGPQGFGDPNHVWDGQLLTITDLV